MKKINYALIIILLLSATLFFFKLGAASVWDNDEGQLLGSAVEMIGSGDYLTPHLNSEIYFHKPPLYAWLTVPLFRLFGYTEFWGRFWAALFGVLGVYITYLLARRIQTERAGLFSALVLSTSILYMALSRMALVDIALTFFVTLAFYLFYLGYKEPGNRYWYFGFYAALALGTLSKSLLGVIIPAVSIFIFLLLERRLDFILKMRLLPGALIYALITFPWFIIETIRHGSYFLNVLFGQYLFSIYLAPMQQHPGPIYYYLIVILLLMLPWSGLLAVALFKRPQGLLLSWAGVTLLIFSTAATKVPGYIMPAFPALALICGSYMDETLGKKEKRGLYFASVFALLIMALALLSTFYLKIPAEYLSALAALRTMLMLVVAGFALAYLLAFFRSIYTYLAWATVVAAFFLSFIVFFLPLAEDHKYTADLVKAISPRSAAAYYKTWLPPSLVFYLNRQSYPTVVKHLESEKELKKFLGQKTPAFVLTTKEEQKHWSYPILKEKAGYAIIGSRRAK